MATLPNNSFETVHTLALPQLPSAPQLDRGMYPLWVLVDGALTACLETRARFMTSLWVREMHHLSKVMWDSNTVFFV